MSEIFKEAAESTISTWGQWIGKSMTYGSAGAMTFFGALSSDLVFGALGVGVALAGYLLNRFYKRKEDARASVRARRELFRRSLPYSNQTPRIHQWLVHQTPQDSSRLH